MALTGKLESEIEIKASAEKFYNVWKSECHRIPTAAPNHMQGVEVHEGDWHSAGAIKFWNYTVEGKKETFKERIEVDDENMTVVLVGLEGDVFERYKSWKGIIKVLPKESGGLVKFTLEYEKLKEDIPVPHAYYDFLVNVMKDIDAHLLQA